MNDPTLDEIRRVRHEISAEIGPHLDGLVERYAKLEARFTQPPLTPKDRQNTPAAGAVTSAAVTNVAHENTTSPTTQR